VGEEEEGARSPYEMSPAKLERSTPYVLVETDLAASFDVVAYYIVDGVHDQSPLSGTLVVALDNRE